MADHSKAQRADTPRLIQYLAVPTDDSELLDAAKTCEANLRWASSDHDSATARDWRAYHNLLQLIGMISTARIGNARQVWEDILEFVELKDMANLELPPSTLRQTDITTAKQVMQMPQSSSQSPSPAYTPSKAEPSTGEPQSQGGSSHGLSAGQMDRINQNRQMALARREAKRKHADIEAADAAAATCRAELLNNMQGRITSMRYNSGVRTDLSACTWTLSG